MAKAQGVSHAIVHRIWQAHGLQPHRVETFKLSRDPEFVKKLRDVVGIYLNPPDKAVVFCVDEKPQVQALDRTEPVLPLKDKVRVTLAGKGLDATGLLYDFVHLKQVIQGVIRGLYHRYLNELKPFDTLNPSAENLARYIYDETARQLLSSTNGAGVSSVTVWETDTSAATYRP